MSILNIIGEIVKPVASLIDSLHTSGEEKDTLKNELTKIENQFSARVLDYEMKMTEMKSNIIVTEAKGESWLQRSWRPITMLTFLCLIVLHYLGLLAFEIADQMWVLLQIGIGGYITSRGVEKIVPAIAGVLAKKKGDNNNG